MKFVLPSVDNYYRALTNYNFSIPWREYRAIHSVGYERVPFSQIPPDEFIAAGLSEGIKELKSKHMICYFVQKDFYRNTLKPIIDKYGGYRQLIGQAKQAFINELLSYKDEFKNELIYELKVGTVFYVKQIRYKKQSTLNCVELTIVENKKRIPVSIPFNDFCQLEVEAFESPSATKKKKKVKSSNEITI